MKKIKLTKDEKKAIPFLIPELIVMGVLIIYPLLYILYMSFTNNRIGTEGFAGLYNYISVFKNPQFGQAIQNTVKWTVGTVLFSWLLGFIYALAINKKSIRGKGFWRGIIFIAWVIPGVVKATTWKWLFTTDGGMFNHLLMQLGITGESIPWLTDPDYAMLALIIVQVWACAPYVMLMTTAGLQQLPNDLYESADLDGAGWWDKMRYITLPLLKDISFICVLMLMVWAINEFSLIWIMTSGGQRTTTLALLVYNQFKVLNLNAASASAIMQLMVTMIFAAIYIKFVVKEE